MASKGITIAEECHIVNALPPLDIDVSAQTTDWLHLKNHSHVTFIIQMGVTGATCAITVEEASDASGTGNTAIAFNYYAEETAAGDTLTARTAATASGITSSGNNSIMYVIEIDASQLSDGKPWVAVQFADPGAATFASCVAILSGSRFGAGITATAIV